MKRSPYICWMLASVVTLSAQSPGPWKPLFDGKDLERFTQSGAAQWKVDSGVVVGGQGATGQRGSSLVTRDLYKDVELELDFMLAEHEAYNSGVYLRTGYQ